MKFDEDDKRQVKELHLITGVDLEQVERVSIGFFIDLLLSYYENEEVRLPLLGDFKARYSGDELNEDNKNETKVEIEFTPHPALKRLIGQVEDEKATGVYNSNDAYQLLMKEIKYALQNHLE